MPRARPVRRMPRHHLALHRPPPRGASGPEGGAVRTSDLVLALLGVALLGTLALAAALVLTLGPAAP